MVGIWGMGIDVTTQKDATGAFAFVLSMKPRGGRGFMVRPHAQARFVGGIPTMQDDRAAAVSSRRLAAAVTTVSYEGQGGRTA